MFNLFSLNFVVSTNLNVGHQFVIKCFRAVSVFKSRLDSFGAFLSGLKLGEGGRTIYWEAAGGRGAVGPTVHFVLFTVHRWSNCSLYCANVNSVLNTV